MEDATLLKVSDLLCISGWRSIYSNAHRRVVDVVSEPAVNKSMATRRRFL